MAKNTNVNDVEKTLQTDNTPVIEVKIPEVKTDIEKPVVQTQPGYNKIELLCNVYAGNTLYKAGTILELTDEELKKYAESFYKKL